MYESGKNNSLLLADDKWIQFVNKLIQSMQNSVRNTAKFNPFQIIDGVSYNTSSVIKITQFLAGSRIKSIQWRRRFEDLIERLHHLDGLFEYNCSQLDKDFTIQTVIQMEIPGQKRIETKINMYGPIILPPQYSFLVENLNYRHEEFEIDIVSSKKIYSCIILFAADQIYLKNKSMNSSLQLPIPVSDSLNCFVQKSNGVDILIFPNFFVKFVILKIFNEIIANYDENFEPVMMKMSEVPIYNQAIKTTNIKWKKLLIRLNYLKQDNSRRMSMPQIISNVVKMPVEESQHKKIADRYSMDKASNQNHTKQSYMKKSETFQRNVKTQKKSNNFLQNQIDLAGGSENQPEPGQQLFADIQGVLYDENEPEQQVIQLSDSFQELENKSTSEKQMKKWEIVKANKKQREAQNNRRKQLQKTLQELGQKNEQLLQTNQKLKQELQVQKNQNYSALISSERLKLAHLRREYEKMLQETNKRHQQMGRVPSNMQRSAKF